MAVTPEAELCSALSCLQTDPQRAAQACMLECSEIALLNNTHYHDCFSRALDKLLSTLRSGPNPEGPDASGESPSADPLYVLDVSEGFSVLSLMAARLGSVRAYSSVEKEQHQAVLRLLAEGNGVQQEALEFWLNQVEDDSAVLQRPATEKLWSAIVLDCVETCGLLRQKLVEKATLARCLLEDGGRIFPEIIVVYGLLVESDTLLLESAVQGREPTLGFNIAPFINQFTVPVHVFLDLSTLECKHLSQPVELFTLDLMNCSENATQRQVEVQVCATGRVTAIPFWYQVHLDQDISISTFTQDSHWKQAAVVLQHPLEVTAGETVCLSVHLHKSSISITALKEEQREGPVAMDSASSTDTVS